MKRRYIALWKPEGRSYLQRRKPFCISLILLHRVLIFVAVIGVPK